MKRRLLAGLLSLCLMVGMAAVPAGAAGGARTTETGFQSKDLTQKENWIQDRAKPETWEITGGKIQFTVSEALQSNSWYDWQGLKGYSGLGVNGYWSVEYTMSVGADMLEQENTNCSVWIQVDEAGGNTAESQRDCVDWAIIQFLNQEEGPCWQSWDAKGSGSWKTVDGLAPVEGEHTIRTEFVAGTIRQYIDGVLVNTYAVSDGEGGKVEQTAPASVIAQARSYGASFDVSIGVPEFDYALAQVYTGQELQAVVAGAQEGVQIQLMDDVHLDEGVTIEKSLTIDGGDRTIYGVNNDTDVRFLVKGGDVTVENAKVTQFGGEVGTTNEWGLFKVPADADPGVSFTARNLEVSMFNRGAFDFNAGTFAVENCEIDCANSSPEGRKLTKGVFAGYGARGSVKDTEIINASSQYADWSAAGIEIWDDAQVEIMGCKLERVQHGVYVYVYGEEYGLSPKAVLKDTAISAGDCAVLAGTYVDGGAGNVRIESGSYTGAIGYERDESVTEDALSISITGGSYSEDPTPYLAGGYGARQADGRYEVAKQCTVNLVYGTWQDTQVVVLGDKLTRPADPEREGFIFDGWYRDSSFTSKWDFQTDTVSGDMTLYGRWVEDAPAPHEHTFSTQWSWDDSWHWHAATCEHSDVVADQAAHTWDSGVVTKQPTYSETGIKTYTCSICTGTKTEILDKLTRPSGGGGGGGSSSGDKTETTANPDGSTTTTVTKPDGTVIETTKNPDGSKKIVEAKKDGTVTTTATDSRGNETKVVENPDGSAKTTVKNTDGSTSTTTVTRDGRVDAQVKLPAAVVNGAADRGEAVMLPIPELPVTSSRAMAPTVTVDLPAGTDVLVEIPVDGVTPGTVAILVDARGAERVVRASIPTENGLAVALSHGATVKIVDNAQDFSDVSQEHWAKDYIDFATSRELFAGTGADTFSPEQAMTRAMIVTVLASLDGVETTGEPWYEAGRQWAMENGVSDGSNIEGVVTREQLAVMLWRQAGSPAAEKDLSAFTDAADASEWAVEALSWAVENGLLSGVGDGRLGAQSGASRAQVVTILTRFVIYQA